MAVLISTHSIGGSIDHNKGPEFEVRLALSDSQDRNLCCEDLDWSVTEVAVQMFIRLLVLTEFVFSGFIQVRLVA